MLILVILTDAQVLVLLYFFLCILLSNKKKVGMISHKKIHVHSLKDSSTKGKIL